MKFFPLTVALFFLWSCNDQQQQRNTQARPPIRKSVDTAQASMPGNPYAQIDISPVDISYYPSDYPIAKMSHKNVPPPVARVIYSRPHRQGRKIFGALLKYGEPWRLGANEATELELFQPVTIQNKRIPAGRYVLYTIPQEKKWTIVFNSNIYSWGLRPDAEKDLYKFDVPVEKSTTTVEYFSMVFEGRTGGANLIMAWDDVVTKLPISF